MPRFAVRRLLAAALLLATMLMPFAASATAATAAAGCRRLVATSAPVLGIGACPGVRPGALVEIVDDDGSAFCTLNFAFTAITPAGADRRYIGTAGHCALGEGPLGQEGGGQRVWKPGTGPVAKRADGTVIGRVRYAVLSGDYDFALINVRDGITVSPKMCTFGGPTGLRNDKPTSTVRLAYHGQGLALGQTVPGRTAVALGMPDAHHVTALGAAISGDSGSGVISADGRAVGVLVSIGLTVAPIGPNGSSDSGVVNVSRLGPLMSRAEGALGENLTLRRAPVVP